MERGVFRSGDWKEDVQRLVWFRSVRNGPDGSGSPFRNAGMFHRAPNNQLTIYEAQFDLIEKPLCVLPCVISSLICLTPTLVQLESPTSAVFDHFGLLNPDRRLLDVTTT